MCGNLHSTIEMISSIIGTLQHFQQKLPVIVITIVPGLPHSKQNILNSSFAMKQYKLCTKYWDHLPSHTNKALKKGMKVFLLLRFSFSTPKQFHIILNLLRGHTVVFMDRTSRTKWLICSSVAIIHLVFADQIPIILMVLYRSNLY